MPSMTDLAKTLILIGAVLVIAGVVVLFVQKLPSGKLPGDIIIRKDNFTFYFPLATSIIISIIVSLVLYLIQKFK
jgi:hypothetical protein